MHLLGRYNKIGTQNYIWQETTEIFEYVSERERVTGDITILYKILYFIAARK